MDKVQIIEYRPDLTEYFKSLNVEWLEKYFYVEDYDNEVLGNPQKYIIDKGGTIFFALLNNEVVGTCALMLASNGEFELTKMAVTEKAQGGKIGKKLAIAIIGKAREMKLKKIFLESNSILVPALTLYEKLGFQFKQKDSGSSVYARANVYMELEL